MAPASTPAVASVRHLRKSLVQSAAWMASAAVFALLILFWQGHQPAIEFVTGYIVELSLSIDNLFIFLLIFRYFAVPEPQQRRVLFWGIFGALVMRGAFILVGVGLIARFHWIFYGLGAVLVYSGIRLGVAGEHRVDPANNPAVNVLRKILPVTADYRGSRFLVREGQGTSGLYATPLLIVLLVIETTDLLFAVDSIPAVLAITLNAFIVYSSNVFALIGLRSLFFAVSGLMKSFRFLHTGLAVILVLIGLKMIAEFYFKIPTWVTLAVVAGVLAISIFLSMAIPAKNPKQE